MPKVDIYFPGTASDYTYHNPDTGLDEEKVEWTFNAIIDGRPETVSGVFDSSVSEESAAYWIRQEEMLAADESETGGGGSGGGGGDSGGGGGGGGGDSGGGIPGTSGSGTEIGHVAPPPEKKKTADGT